MSTEVSGNSEILWLLLGMVVLGLIWVWAHSQYLRGYATGGRDREAMYWTYCKNCRHRQRDTRITRGDEIGDFAPSIDREFGIGTEEGGNGNGDHGNGDS